MDKNPCTDLPPPKMLPRSELERGIIIDNTPFGFNFTGTMSRHSRNPRAIAVDTDFEAMRIKENLETKGVRVTDVSFDKVNPGILGAVETKKDVLKHILVVDNTHHAMCCLAEELTKPNRNGNVYMVENFNVSMGTSEIVDDINSRKNPPDIILKTIPDCDGDMVAIVGLTRMNGSFDADDPIPESSEHCASMYPDGRPGSRVYKPENQKTLNRKNWSHQKRNKFPF